MTLVTPTRRVLAAINTLTAIEKEKESIKWKDLELVSVLKGAIKL